MSLWKVYSGLWLLLGAIVTRVATIFLLSANESALAQDRENESQWGLML